MKRIVSARRCFLGGGRRKSERERKKEKEEKKERVRADGRHFESSIKNTGTSVHSFWFEFEGLNSVWYQRSSPFPAANRIGGWRGWRNKQVTWRISSKGNYRVSDIFFLFLHGTNVLKEREREREECLCQCLRLCERLTQWVVHRELIFPLTKSTSFIQNDLIYTSLCVCVCVCMCVCYACVWVCR